MGVVLCNDPGVSSGSYHRIVGQIISSSRSTLHIRAAEEAVAESSGTIEATGKDAVAVLKEQDKKRKEEEEDEDEDEEEEVHVLVLKNVIASMGSCAAAGGGGDGTVPRERFL